jgi:hypothetical protein
MSIPRNLKFGGKVESAPSRSSRVNIAPVNGLGNYGLGDTIQIALSSRSNLLLVPSESYLKFNLAVTNGDGAANTYRMDSAGAHCIIKSIKLYSGSNLLQDIDTYSGLAKILFDLQVSTPASYGKYSMMAGTRPDQIITGAGGAAVVGTAGSGLVNGVTVTNAAPTNDQLTAVINSLAVNQINAGSALATGVAAGATSTSQTYCLSLISLMGSLCQSNYFPLFACQNSTIRMEITLHDTLNKMFVCQGAGVGGIVVNNCEYVANYIELSDSAMGMVQASLQGQPLQMVVPDWRNFQYSQVIANDGLYNIPIAAKFASLKSLILMSRDKFNTATYYPHSSAVNGLSSYYFRIGPVILPPKPPNTLPEMACELFKSISGLSDLAHMPSIDKQSYQLAGSTVQTSATLLNGQTTSGSFYIGLDLESYPNAAKDGIYAGMSTISDDIYLSLQYGTVVNAGSIRYDVYANFDTLLVFENGVGFARF